MESILVKILAVVLALSQVSTRPDQVKTQFDSAADRNEVAALLRAGCAHMRKVFEVEDLQLDDLVETALADPKAITGDIKAFRGINFEDLHAVYREFCQNETLEKPPVDIGDVIAFYNKAATDLPDHMRLKGLRLPSPSTVLDGKNNYFAELYEPGNRRIAVPLSEIPATVQRAFVAAEDKRFYQHKGIDERGLVRAFVVNMMQPGRPQGGSTITQQVVKNLLVGDDVTYDRKVREILVASRVEQTLSKAEILELYLNSIYFGRNAWGVEMAARSYFGKSAKDLTLSEGALLAALVKGPNYFSPDRAPDRARERLDYVLNRMQEDGAITAEAAKQADTLPRVVAYEQRRNDVSRYFFDYLTREVKTLPGVEPLANATYTIHSTIYPDLQRATEAALQEGLTEYERKTGRVDFQGPEANLSDAIKQILAERNAAPTGAPTATQQATSVPARPNALRTALPPPPGAQASLQGLAPATAPAPAVPAWQQALANLRLPLYDVHWLPAVVVEKPANRKGADALRVGLTDGRVLPLHAGRIGRQLQIYDVVFVRVVEGRSARADLRVRPQVQGAALVMENKTGRILAMAGGFSYPLSQLNRTSQTRRQPGSALKPLSYLAALRAGLQPNTLVRDEPITLPPIGGGYARDRDYWSPKNYDGGAWGVTTLRRALENSRNLATANLLDGGIDSTPERSLDRVCELAMEAQLYSECVHYYPFVLGAQPVRLIDLAAFYAAVANEGARPKPHAIATVEQDGRSVYRDDTLAPTWLGSADRAAFYQLKSMMQGVVQRGTANSIRQLAPYVAGKTGTTDDENDAWFVGFSNDVTVAVWVGYDNATSRRTLGSGQTGGHVAVPIFEPIMKAAWTYVARQVALAPPSAEARRQLVSVPIDLASGSRIAAGERGERTIYEYFRLDGRGRLAETQYRLVGPEEADSFRYGDYSSDGQEGWTRGYSFFGNPLGGQAPTYYREYRSPQPTYRQPQPNYGAQQQNEFRNLFGGWMNEEGDRRERQRRYDPDYFWNNNRMN
jgi:penicillin-binding protein 1A